MPDDALLCRPGSDAISHERKAFRHDESVNPDMNDREKRHFPFFHTVCVGTDAARLSPRTSNSGHGEGCGYRLRRLREGDRCSDITDEQIAELEAHARGRQLRGSASRARNASASHDVMSHVYAYGKQCPQAEGIIHLGATSCYVGDNTDVIILREASEISAQKGGAGRDATSPTFADKYKGLPCLAYTHLQPAQLTTVRQARDALGSDELLRRYRRA